MILQDLTKIYNVNKGLEDEIFSKIPKDFSCVEQAIFIYNELCERLNYSVDFYIDESSNYAFFTYARNLELIDGKTHKDVVCFTFDRIFLKMLYDKKLISAEDFWENACYAVAYNHLKPEHNVMRFSIDEQDFVVDGTMGVFKSSDLSESKFEGYQISGWRISDCKTKKQLTKFQNSLKKVRSMSDAEKLRDDVKNYINLKVQQDDFKRYSIDLRVHMYMNFVCEYGHIGEMQLLTYAYKMKNSMFSDRETNLYIPDKTKVAIQFINNAKKNCPSILIYYNVEDEIKTYQIDLKAPMANFERRNVEEIKKERYAGDFEYATCSKTIDEMIKPIEEAVRLCQESKKYDERKDL